jgi:hypothetical protein
MSFVKGADRKGTVELPPYPVQFAGLPGVEIKAKQKDITSDAMAVPVTEGLWYLQESYASPKFSYAYGVEGFFSSAGDAHDVAAFKKHNKGSWAGNAYRIDVFTTDKRPVIACYGDSITHGFGSTPGSGNSYPEILSRLLKRPTLNLGVNSDMALRSGQLPGLVTSLKGVDSVIYLMGINDIVLGALKSRAEYMKVVKEVSAGLRAKGVKFYL